MDDPDSALRPRPFRKPGAMPGPLTADTAAALLMAAGDLTLILDRDGRVLDIASSDPRLAEDGIDRWPGHPLADLVTADSRAKIVELIADAAAGRATRWRQVTHSLISGEVPVRYACVSAGDRLIAIGRDLRGMAAMQQRLLQAQQSLERDYLRLRQTESRYRLLFDLSDEAVLIVEAATRRILEANAAAHRLLGSAPGALVRQPVGAIAAPDDEELLVAQIGAGAAGPVGPVAIRLRGGGDARLSATPFRQDRATFLLVRLAVDEVPVAAPPADVALRQAVERMPDAFVLTDQRFIVRVANAAFIELAQAISKDAVAGAPLGEWLGRPGIDLDLIGAQLREHGVARNVATILRGSAGAQEEVELSGVMVEGEEGPFYGLTIRSVARRLRDMPPAARDLPRSTEQLTELVGRMSLKEIVRESTDLIERLCIEAALTYTSDNRASAAEILGLSRQSLYSKLHRHGLGNLVDERD